MSGLTAEFHILSSFFACNRFDYYTSSTDAQADLRLCLNATKSSFSQQGTYGMGLIKQTLIGCRDHLKGYVEFSYS